MTRVTVLSAMYNDAAFIREAVDSVLTQTFGDFEYLFVNDACIDASREIVASYRDPRIRILDNPTNLGLTRSLNRGLAEARGELIARFDANDVCFPERLARQVAFLDAHPDVAAVGVQSQIIDVASRRIRRAESRRPVTDVAIPWYCMFDVPLIHSATMFRRSVVRDTLGGYDETFRVGQDAELWSRLLRHGFRLANLDERLIAVRFDPRSISGDVNLEVRRGFLERWLELANANMKLHLQTEDVPEEWQQLSVRMSHPSLIVPAADAMRFVEVVERCYARFCELHPEATGNPDIARSRVVLLARAAEKAAVAGGNALSMRIFRKMAAVDFRHTAVRLPRLAAMWIGGERAVRMWRRWRRRSA